MAYLTTQPLSGQRIAYLEQRVKSSGCGAMVSFVGVVRPDWNGGRQVRALFYDAYAEMAERQIQRLIQEARARWLLSGVETQHRLGLIECDQVSVVVMVAAPHRAEAYAASQFLIEQIKHEVPIWKRALYDDGTTQWVTCSPVSLTVADPSGVVHADV